MEIKKGTSFHNAEKWNSLNKLIWITIKDNWKLIKILNKVNTKLCI